MTITNKMLGHIQSLYELWADICLNDETVRSSLAAFRPEERYNSDIQGKLRAALAAFRLKTPYQLFRQAVNSDDALKQAFQTLSFQAAINAAQEALSGAREGLESVDQDISSQAKTLRALQYKNEQGVFNRVRVWSRSAQRFVEPMLSVAEVERREQAWEKEKPRVERDIQSAKYSLSFLKANRTKFMASQTAAIHKAEYQCLLLHSLEVITQLFEPANKTELHQNKQPVQPRSGFKQENDSTVQAVLSLIINKESVAMEAVNKAGDMCDAYTVHLGGGAQEQSARDLAYNKKIAIKEIQSELVLPSTLKCKGTALFASARLRAAATLLAKSQNDMVKQRTPFVAFLKVLAFVLAPIPVALYSYKTRGTPWFWRSHGDVLVSKMEKPLGVGSSPVSGC